MRCSWKSKKTRLVCRDISVQLPPHFAALTDGLHLTRLTTAEEEGKTLDTDKGLSSGLGSFRFTSHLCHNGLEELEGVVAKWGAGEG